MSETVAWKDACALIADVHNTVMPLVPQFAARRDITADEVYTQNSRGELFMVIDQYESALALREVSK